MAAEMAAADSVLEEIGAGDKPRLLVLNKIDLLDAGEGLDELRAEVERTFEETMTPVELLVPYSQGARLHELHEVAGKVARKDGPEGVLVKTRLPLGELHRFEDLAVESAANGT